MKPNMHRILLLLFLILPHKVSAASHGGAVGVSGYTTRNGTQVAPYHRSAPDGNFNNNWSTKGNVNPYTGKVGTRVTPPHSGSYASGARSSAHSTSSALASPSLSPGSAAQSMNQVGVEPSLSTSESARPGSARIPEHSRIQFDVAKITAQELGIENLNLFQIASTEINTFKMAISYEHTIQQ